MTRPSRRSMRASAWARLSTSRATIRRCAAGKRCAAGRRSLDTGGGMVLLQALNGDLSLEQGLDAAEGRLGAVHRGVVGDVLGDRGAADQVRVAPRAAVLRGVEDQRDLVPL